MGDVYKGRDTRLYHRFDEVIRAVRVSKAFIGATHPLSLIP